VVRSFNAAALKLTQKASFLPSESEETILGKNLLDLLPAEEREFWKENISRSRSKSIEIDSHRLKTVSEDIIVRLRISPFDHMDDGVDGRIIVIEDITDKVIIEQYLVLSEKMIAKGEMAAAIGHELNNYLATISSNAQLLPINIANNQMDKVAAKVDAIVSNIDKMKRFTAGLMDFSGLETRKVAHDISRLIDDVIFFVKPQQKFRGIDIKLDVPGELPQVEIDVGQIHQVLLNLLLNAADAIRERDLKDGRIRISCRQENNDLIIAVADNGSGIPEEILPRIFEPYVTSKKTGHGLGLSTSYRIVSNHKGRLSAINNADSGATFTVELPLR
jgi:signal transduction histidine kinase